MATANLLYTSAIDSTGKLVTALQAEKGNLFLCPLCNGEMILKKSGNVGPGSRRPHFSHKALSPNCTPEGVLHHSFKMMLANILRTKLKKEEPFHFSFECSYCGNVHNANLLKITQEVAVEKKIGPCIPDILLIDKNGKAYLAIEIVVTHAPEKETLKYYQENGIALYRLNIASGEDLDDVEERAKRPDEFWFCKNPKCPMCGFFMDKKIMAIREIKCYRCHMPMKISLIISSAWQKKHHFSIRSPRDFDGIERRFAKEHEAIVGRRYSKIMEETYQVNVCSQCKAFIGEHYLFDYMVELEYDDENKENSLFKYFDMGWFCPRCEMGIGNEDDEG